MIYNNMVLLVVVALSLQVLAVADTGIKTPNRLMKNSTSQGRRNLDFTTSCDDILTQAEEAITALDEPVTNLDVTDDEVSDNSTLAKGEGFGDRRNLYSHSCHFEDSPKSGWYHWVKVRSVWIKAGDTGHYFCSKHQNAQFRTEATKFKVTIEVEDDDTACPGCIEQVHVGLMDDIGVIQWNENWSRLNHQCVNLGAGNFGRRKLDFEFSARRHTSVTVFVVNGAQYHCKGNEDHYHMGRHLFYHGQKFKVARITIS